MEKAHRLYRCFPKSEADDPEAFAAAVAALLTRYPDDVIEKVTHPVDGIPATLKWRPVLSEVREACEREMEPVYRARERERRRQESERVLAAANTPRVDRPTYDDLKEKHGHGWGIRTAEDDTESKAKRDKQMAAASREWFRRECEAAGIDSARGYSPTLEEIVNRKARA